MKNWYSCELHCHTVHSDGKFTVDELISTAKQRELSGICLTDHNTISGHEECDKEKDIAILKGVEYTTYHGHMLCLGMNELLCWYNITDIDETISYIKEKGGIVGIAHPFQIGTPICTGGHWDYEIKNWENVNYMEIFSEGSPFLNTANKKARELWHSLLNKGYRITPTMGRDWHNKEKNIFPSACTFLLCDGEITADKMKQAIKNGKTVVSAGPLFYFTANGKNVGDEISCGEVKFNFTVDLSHHEKVDFQREIVPEYIKIISNDGESEYIFTNEITLNLKSNSWYSAELWGSINGKKDMLLALTAPIYTKG